jgi:hypothetical protein
VLAGAGLGDDALLAHALGEQALAEGVVDLVGAGVEEVFALEVDTCAAEFFGEALGEVEGGGASAVVVEELGEAGLEGGVGGGLGVGGFELLEGGHEGLGDVAAAVGTETAGDLAGFALGGRVDGCCAHLDVSLLRCRGWRADESRDC